MRPRVVVVIYVCMALGLSLLLTCSCATNSKVARLRHGSSGPARVSVSIPSEYEGVPMGAIGTDATSSDTLMVRDEDGRDMIIMRAVRDEDGEMVATDVIDAAVVTARFRNVAERHGKVNLEFQLRVPSTMLDRGWQLRFCPRLQILGQTLALDSLLITGQDYRKAQLKGYEQYNRFLNSIITDTLKMVDKYQLEMFIRRNLPEIYAYKSDSTGVSDEVFYSHYGVGEQEALSHYTNSILMRINSYRRSKLPEVYARRVKSPLLTEGIRLDTVITDPSGDFIYNYVQTIPARSDLRRVDVIISGAIYEQGRAIYQVPDTDPLTFYISSVSQFADLSDHYLTEVVERRAAANTACYIEFASGSDVVVDTLGANSSEIGRIKDNLRTLVDSDTFDLDSIVVTASCSPEGSYTLNEALSRRRSESVSRYFGGYVESLTDQVTPISFDSRSVPENWQMLSALVERDESLSDSDKSFYRESLLRLEDPDSREHSLQDRPPLYRYLRKSLYPRVRTVKFDFYLHRRGMIKDTIHATRVDSTYMRGVRAILDRDYETAVSILRPYHDLNCAVAYCALDYNHSALEILQTLEQTPRVLYMIALIYARMDDPERAVQYYLDACRSDRTYINRGNLDPEISQLINTYNLNTYLQL